MRFLHQWRMALLFMISGAGVYFSLASRSGGKFLKERFIRIFIPLLVGMFIIVPPQIYLERLTQGQTFSYLQFYPSVFEFVSYPKGSFSWHHLWYLAYIFIYSVLALPLLLFIKNSSKLTNWLADIFASPIVLIAVPVAWHVLGNAWLEDRFPDTNNLTRDWNNHFHSFSLFITGFILCTQPRFWEILKRWRKLNLGIWICITTVLYAFYWGHDRDFPEWSIQIYRVIKVMNAWCILLSIFGYAYVYLRFSNPFLKYANEAVYPFYILHQTVIIILAYPIIDAGWPVWTKFSYLCIATFLICLGLYEVVIRRNNMLRFAFGLKPLRKEKDKAEFQPSQI